MYYFSANERKICSIKNNVYILVYILTIILIILFLGTVTVNWEGWKTIDDVEIRRGKDRNKPREKITDVDEMLKIGGSSD